MTNEDLKTFQKYANTLEQATATVAKRAEDLEKEVAYWKSEAAKYRRLAGLPYSERVSETEVHLTFGRMEGLV